MLVHLELPSQAMLLPSYFILLFLPWSSKPTIVRSARELQRHWSGLRCEAPSPPEELLACYLFTLPRDIP